VESAAVVVARTGSRAAVLRRSESTRFSSTNDDKVGGLPARSTASGSEKIKQRKQRLGSLQMHCSLRSLRLALVSRCLPHSLRSLVQDSGAPAWLRAAAREPG
jgi:hypothetical protein